jgi:hypothetical protein
MRTASREPPRHCCTRFLIRDAIARISYIISEVATIMPSGMISGTSALSPTGAIACSWALGCTLPT